MATAVIQYWNSLSRYLSTDEELEQYLLIGVSEGLLKDFQFLPTLKRNRKRNWIPFFLRLAERVARGDVMNIYGKEYPYAKLAQAVQMGIDIMRNYGMEQGLNPNANLNELCSSYGVDFDIFLESLENDLFQKFLSGRELTSLDDTPINIQPIKRQSVETNEFIVPESDIEDNEENITESESDNEDLQNLNIEKDDEILKKLSKKIERMTQKEGIKKVTKSRTRNTREKLKAKRETKKKEKKKKDHEDEDLPKEIFIEKKKKEQEKVIEPDFILDEKTKRSFVELYCTQFIDRIYSDDKLFEQFVGRNSRLIKYHEPKMIYNTGPNRQINWAEEYARFCSNIKYPDGTPVNINNRKEGEIISMVFDNYEMYYMYVKNNWWYIIGLNTLENFIYTEFLRIFIEDNYFYKMLDSIDEEAERLGLKKGKISEKGEPIVLKGDEIEMPKYKDRDKRFVWLPSSLLPVRNNPLIRYQQSLYLLVCKLVGTQLQYREENGQVLCYFITEIPPECDALNPN